MIDQNQKSKLGLGIAFYTLFLVPIALAGVAVAALFTGYAAFVQPVLIAVLVFAVIFTILYFLFLHRFIDCDCDN